MVQRRVICSPTMEEVGPSTRWSDEVHDNRVRQALISARLERKQRKAGLPVPLMESANTGQFLLVASAVSSVYAWMHFGRRLLDLPAVRQLRSVVFGKAAAPRTTGGASTSASSSSTNTYAGPSKAAGKAAASRAARAAVKPLPAGSPLLQVCVPLQLLAVDAAWHE